MSRDHGDILGTDIETGIASMAEHSNETQPDRVDFQPLTPQFASNPYKVYERLRALEEPYYFEDMNVHLLSRYEDVEAAARQGVMVRSLAAVMSPDYVREEQKRANFHDMPNHEQLVQLSMLEQDGANHRRLRMLVLREFSRQFVEKHRDMIQRYVDRLLEPLLEKQEFDFVAELASHVPGHIIGNILGVPDEDCPQLRVWSENIVQYFDADRTDTNKQLAESATSEFKDYLIRLIAERESKPREDLLSVLISARNAGELDENELVSLSLLILAGGHGSTIDVLGTGLLALLSHPDQHSKLRSAPELTGTAIHEMFRYDSPLPFFHRYASEDVQVMGRTYPKGTKFGLLYGSANRDPAQFPNAHRFEVERTPNRHIAFGRGAHLCLGNNLARLDMEIIFKSLLARTEDIQCDTENAHYKPGLAARGLIELPVRLIPAARL